MVDQAKCKKCGAPLVIKSKGTFNYVGCPTCVSAKKAKSPRLTKAGEPDRRQAKEDPPKKDPPKKDGHWLDDYL
jgi:uncharacterized Zn finger protein (UPF0148 family)